MRMRTHFATAKNILLTIATFVVSQRSLGSAVNGDPIHSHKNDLELSDTSANDTLPMTTYMFYNGTHLESRQINPNIPAWARPYALRGKQQFFTATETEKNYLMEMMGDMWILAIAAVEAMGKPEAPIYSTSFLRYFTPEEWGDVRDGFNALIGCTRPFEGPEELKYLELYWDITQVTTDRIPSLRNAPSCADRKGDYGFGLTNAKALSRYVYYIIICPYALSFRTVLRPFQCSLLQDRRIADKLMTGGQMMMHELMHWTYVSEKAVKVRNDVGTGGITDWNSNELTGGLLDPNAYPLTGYGPYNAMLVNKLLGRGSSNPDNYVYFAYEAYLLQDNPETCGGNNMNPPLTDFLDPLP